jgi:hypothetical protein
MPPRRREADKEDATTGIIRSAAKATVAFVFFGILSFVGTWGISLSSGVAKLREDVAVINEKQLFLAPWLVDSLKELKEDLKELRNEVKQLRRP